MRLLETTTTTAIQTFSLNARLFCGLIGETSTALADALFRVAYYIQLDGVEYKIDSHH
jgi:hypothetical protein